MWCHQLSKTFFGTPGIRNSHDVGARKNERRFAGAVGKFRLIVIRAGLICIESYLPGARLFLYDNHYICWVNKFVYEPSAALIGGKGGKGGRGGTKQTHAKAASTNQPPYASNYLAYNYRTRNN